MGHQKSIKPELKKIGKQLASLLAPSKRSQTSFGILVGPAESLPPCWLLWLASRGELERPDSPLCPCPGVGVVSRPRTTRWPLGGNPPPVELPPLLLLEPLSLRFREWFLLPRDSLDRRRSREVFRRRLGGL